VRRAGAHLAELAASLDPRVVYTDLDGTLFGPGGSLYATPEGGITEAASEAVAALHRAGTALVPVSGRTETQVREVARILGADGFIAELGGITARGDTIAHEYGTYRGPGTPRQQMARSGAAALLLESFAGRLEPHAPWAHADREVTMLFRGHLDLEEARSVLANAGYRWLDLHDNGIIRRSFPGLDVREVHAYHLVPAGVTKASAVAADVGARGLGRREAVAVGDSASDAEVSSHVGAVFIVANGEHAVAGTDLADNVYLTDAPNGDGFAEVVRGLLG
jgi:hydroxymethylpyrimidine pyrophosphatase-like HAD family hydrolase